MGMSKNRSGIKHYVSYMIVGLAAVILAVMQLTVGLESSTVYLIEKIVIAVILAVSLNLVVGFLGELSLGHAGFMCIGAYLGGKVSCLISGSSGALKEDPVTLIISVLAGGAAAAVFGFIIGLPALRLKGDYLAIVTLGFGEIVKSVFQNTSKESFGGALGLPTPRYDKNYLFIYEFAFLLLALFVIQNLVRSKHGRAITAIRDNEIAARATGINVTKYKLLAFTVSSFFAGVAGVLYSLSNFNVQSSKFGYNYSIEILVMVVLGSIGSINGSIIAATLITIINVKLATVLTGNLAVLQNLLYALILVIIVIYNNAPALKGLREKLTFKNLLAKFNKNKAADPAIIRDDKAHWASIPTKIPMDEVLSVDVTVGNESTAEPDKPEKGE